MIGTAAMCADQMQACDGQPVATFGPRRRPLEPLGVVCRCTTAPANSALGEPLKLAAMGPTQTHSGE